MFDTAPTGHTLRLIRMPELMEAWIRALSRSRQAMLGIEQDDKTDPVMMSLTDRLEGLREFRARLLSPRISAFVLVLVAERLPIEETARAIEQLNEAGVTVGGLVVNRVLPATSPDPFLQSRHAQEVIYLDEIDRRFAKLAARAGAAVTFRRPRRQNPRDLAGDPGPPGQSLSNPARRAPNGSLYDHRPPRLIRVRTLSMPATSPRCRPRSVALLKDQIAEF